MENKITCYGCGKDFTVSLDDYMFFEEGEVCGLRKCPHCGAENGFSYITRTNFVACAFTDKDRKEFKLEDGTI